MTFDLRCPPSNWTNLGTFGCYHFGDEAELMSWFEAEMYCNSLARNAHLAEINDIDTQLILNALADDRDNFAWWLGGTDMFEVDT